MTADATPFGRLAAAPEELESTWIEVIRKMDEVYNELLQHEVALEAKNAALEESQQFIYSVLTSMSDLLLVCDRQGVIEEVNQALVEFTGRTAESLRDGKLCDLLADPVSRQAAAQAIASLESASADDLELQFQAGEGSAPVALNFTARRSGAGKLLGVVITGRPVGELRRAYRALREAHDELKRTQQQLLQSEKMASLGRLVAGVAHELNNPISFVLGNVHAMRRYAVRLKRYLDALHAGADAQALSALRAELRVDSLLADLEPLLDGTVEGAERTRDIVDGLKRFSAADRNENVGFDLVEIVQRSVQMVAQASRPQFRVTLDLPASLPVSGSPGQMQQVVINLVQNAADACDALPEAHLHISGWVETGAAVISFRDNGPGIPPQALGRIFDPFYTTKPIGKGTGLGLSISYGIVERHGGSLSVSNPLGGGAEFIMRIPVIEG